MFLPRTGQTQLGSRPDRYPPDRYPRLSGEGAQRAWELAAMPDGGVAVGVAYSNELYLDGQLVVEFDTDSFTREMVLMRLTD